MGCGGKKKTPLRVKSHQELLASTPPPLCALRSPDASGWATGSIGGSLRSHRFPSIAPLRQWGCPSRPHAPQKTPLSFRWDGSAFFSLVPGVGAGAAGWW